ncbi:hypothetical protein [Nocardia nova]|uniref:hypothetical protein n=1 Tax=Nocardia nova TaxID=37330 RepID=UPI000CE9CF9F|nr:hypothetical protein [Nocardia nova]PPI89059.1 hypothetical protein C5E46_35425 [Nocardia nova]
MSRDALYAEAIRMSGSEPAGGATIARMTDPENLPRDCPHCGDEIACGTGPHVTEAAARGHAHAWECSGCRSAGMLVVS